MSMCGPTEDNQFCACGCGGDDSRCGLYLAYYELTGQQVPSDHTCCQIPGRENKEIDPLAEK